MKNLLNALKMHSGIMQNDRFFSQKGIIVSYDPDQYMARVQLQPASEDGEAFTTGWLRIAAIWVGQGCGIFAAPRVGSLCNVNFQEGDLNTGTIDLLYHSNLDRPLSVPSEELWIVHKSGTSIKLTNDGELSINGNSKVVVTAPEIDIQGATKVNITAPEVDITTTAKINVLASDDISIKGDAKVKVECNDIELGDFGIIAPPMQYIMLSDNSPSLHVKAN